MNTQTPHPVQLFLRTDGSLMLVRGDNVVEMALSPGQLLQLGMDALTVAVKLQPACMPEAAAALANTMILRDDVVPALTAH
jgi:hypothetical protein